MRDNAIPAAFNLVLDELSKAREAVVEDLAVAAKRSDYTVVLQLTERLKRMDTLKDEVGRLQLEWDAIFEPEPLGESKDAGEEVDVPDQYELCGPTLQALHTLGGNGSIRDIVETVIRQMALPEEITRQPHEGSHQTELEWQLGWSRTVLKRCGLVNNPRSGVWVLTEAASSRLGISADEVKILYRQSLSRR